MSNRNKLSGSVEADRWGGGGSLIEAFSPLVIRKSSINSTIIEHYKLNHLYSSSRPAESV